MKEIEFLNLPILEWIGYLASVLVLISLSLSSMLRLRTINLLGSAVFSFYGFAIGSLPVGIMNLVIVFSNLYYLRELFFRKDNFEIIKSDSDQEYIQKFLIYFKKDIQNYFPDFSLQNKTNQMILMVTRNMNLAGLFIATENGDSIEVELDYVTPQYRDYKTGKFIFEHFRNTLKEKKYKTILTNSVVPQQIKYLKKMGFVQNNSVKSEQQFLLRL